MPKAQAQTAPAQVLARGAPLGGANGLSFDAQDRLHVASVGSRSIFVLDPDSGAVLERYGPDAGVEGPDDLTFGPDGSLYWTALFTGAVGRRTPDGVTSTVATLPPGVNPITFSDDGRLFVALDFLGDGLYELDPAGAQPPRLLIEQLGFLNAMDFGPDGRLYGPIYTQGRVVRIDVNARPPTVETVADGFAIPVAVKFNTAGELYALDAARGQVIKLDPTTGAQDVVATLTPGLDNLAFDSRGRLFVSSNDDGFVVEVRPDGTTRTVSPDGMIAPGGIAVRPGPGGDDQLIVADMFSLRAFDGNTGSVADAPHHPANTLFADGDRLLVSSWFANTVAVLDAAGAVVESYADFNLPLNAIRFQGDLVVAELGTASVVRQSGGDAATRIALASGLGVPSGLAATADDLWAADWAAGTLLQLVADGQPLATPRVVAQGLRGPEGLALDRDGSLLVVESGAGAVTRVDPATGQMRSVATGLQFTGPMPGAPPTTVMSSVAVGGDGTIYVTGGEPAGVIYRIEQTPTAPPSGPATLPNTGGTGAGLLLLAALALLLLLSGLALRAATARP
ncbi:MAG TPA: hypothetical protein PKD53_16100 [Chloroflexaceae bacterium]|nr:hypothetical protein [Chloroflexaceae bacterium]